MMASVFSGTIRRLLFTWMAAAASSAPLVPAHAQAYPCTPIKLISPYPPGGTTDILARLISPGLGAALGVTVVVDNKGGASSNIGTEAVARAKPDGCTLLLGNNTGIVINRNLYKLTIDPVKNLTPVIKVAEVPLVLYVNSAAISASNVQELIDLVKASPGKYSYASGGSGSPQHLAGEILKLERGLDLTHVPYRGQGPALSDVIAGHVQIAFETTSALTPYLKSGKIRALATTGSKRAEGLPDLPTMKESGFPEFEVTNWYGVFAPAGTPKPLIERLNGELTKVLSDPDIRGKLAALGSESVHGSSDELREFITREIPFWEATVKRSNARVD
jgi:tripartite-type tricarboxylate transporter receptor subunit TctC